MKSSLISVIIPIYNCEKYIKKLLNLLLKIKNEKIEVILINDGSTDNTKQIINNYKSYFKILNLNKNHGVSYARNIGIKKSNGKYITFIDADDIVSENYFENIFKFIKNESDLYIYNVKLIYKNKENYNSINYNGLVSKEELLKGEFLIPQIISWVTNKVFNKKILIDNKIYFNNKINIGEDLDFMLRVLTITNNIYFKDVCLYYYNRTNNKSLTKSNIINLPYNTYSNNKRVEKFIKNNNVDKKYFNEYKKNIFEYTDGKVRSVKNSVLREQLIKENNNLNLPGKSIKKNKFSIIMPAYNVEKYIFKAINSVLSQTYDNYELIIIDDGSIDNTKSVINSFKDKRIKIIYQNNNGVSSARNRGIKESSGDYIIFLDSDDYIENYALEYINNEINNSNKNTTFIGKFNTIFEKECNRSCKCENLDATCINDRNKKEVLDYLYTKRIIYAVWRFVVSRKLIEKNNLLFMEGIIHEDEEWVPRLLVASKNYKLLDKTFYNYRIRKKSIMTTNRNDLYREECLVKVSQELLKNANKEKNIINKNVYLRNAYKNMFQAYLKIREKANPIEPNNDEKHRLNKNVLVYGSSRSGKTTLSNVIKTTIRYSVISVDNIVSGFEKGMPELKINHSNRDGKSVKNLNNFINAYIKSLNGINQKTRMYYYVIEGSYLSEETILKYKDDFAIIILINDYNSPKEFFDNIKKYDSKADWTINLTDSELMDYCNILYESEKNIKRFCKENNIKYYVTGNNREKVIDDIIENIEEMVKY